MAETPLDIRHVVLPWAPPDTSSPSEDERVGRERVESDARALRVQQDRLAIRKPGEGVAASSGGVRQGLGMPPLLPHGLPFKPHPSIPDEDRVQFHPDALLAAAVALDILATGTRGIEPTPSILTELTETLLMVGRIGGIDDAAVERLLEHADSVVGNSRAGLSRHVAECMAAPPRPEGEPTAVGAAHASTPRAASKALRRLETAAVVAIHESRLRLEAREVVEYRQA